MSIKATNDAVGRTSSSSFRRGGILPGQRHLRSLLMPQHHRLSPSRCGLPTPHTTSSLFRLAPPYLLPCCIFSQSRISWLPEASQAICTAIYVILHRGTCFDSAYYVLGKATRAVHVQVSKQRPKLKISVRGISVKLVAASSPATIYFTTGLSDNIVSKNVLWLKSKALKQLETISQLH